MTEMLSFFLSCTPILLIFVMAIIFRAKALTLAIWGFGYTLLLAAFFFKTSPLVLLLASLDGVATTIPLLLVVYIGVLLSVFLMEKGSLQRLARSLAVGSSGQARTSLLLSYGVGNFLEGAGVIAEPVAAPMIRAAGISATGAAALSVLGYAGLMHLSLAGVIVTVLIAVTGLPAASLTWNLAILSFPATILFAFSIPWIIGTPFRFQHNFHVFLFTGILSAGVALFSVTCIGYSISGLLAGTAVVCFSYLMARTLPTFSTTFLKDTLPFVFIFGGLFAIHFIAPLEKTMSQIAVIPIQFIPGHRIELRPFFDAYLYLFIAFLIAFKLHAEKEDHFFHYLLLGSQKAGKVVLAMALFGAMGQVIAYSGHGNDFNVIDPQHNIALCLANGVLTYTGKYYPVLVPLLGWVGTFLTGYGVASIMLFGKLQLATATQMNISPSLLVSALTVGASVGSISSPFKIALATPLCGAEGREGEILRKTIPLGLGVSIATGIATMMLL